MKTLSFRLQIALLSALVSGLVLLGLGAASWWLLYRQKVEAVDTEIRSLGARHPGWLANRGNFERLNTSLEFVFGEAHKGDIILLVKDAQGQTLYTSPNWPQTLLPASIDCTLKDDPPLVSQTTTNREGGLGVGSPGGFGAGRGRGGMGFGFGAGRGGGPVVFTKSPRFFTAKVADSAWRVGIMGNDEVRLAVGLNYKEISTEMSRVTNAFLLTLPVALLLVGGGGWFIAGRALRPLRTISRTAEQVTARGLDQRIPVSNEDPEISRLIQVLNAMMGRLEGSFQQAVRFSADASHELKTPLAIMQGELENALQSAARGSPEQRVFSNLMEETQRLKTITRGLLLLSQADAGQLKLVLEEIDLSAELEAILEDTRILAADSQLEFEVVIEPKVWVRADRGLLQIALLNLFNNAIKYNEPGGRVAARLTAEQGEAVLSIGNTGPGIPAADQTRVFERFFRADRTRNRTVDGLGLGLSLAREIVLAHQGKLVLQESRPGQTCFALTLKRSAAADR